MSITTLDLNEINQERVARREATEAERPTTQPRKRKWREIEAIKDAKEFAILDPDGDLWE